MMREYEIERQFDVKIESIKPSRGVYILNTNKGIRCLKKIDYGTQKLLFICGAKEHLIENGFDKVDKYCMSIEGNPYALVNEDIYTLSGWIDGRECDFYNKDEIKLAAQTLANLHIASKGYEPPENSKLKSDLNRWPHLLEKRVKSFDKMREMIRKKSNKTVFDMDYIKSMEFYKALGKRSKAVVDTSYYTELCRTTEEDKIFCHHDYTYHNIVIDKQEKVNVIDFDYCKRELRIYDISAFMIKVLKRNKWNMDFAKLIIDSYNEIDVIKEEEYRVLFSYLLFPQRYWRLCNRYYYNEVTWNQNTFNSKIEELVDEQDNYMKFIEDFKSLYNQAE